jgi:aspartate/methionine/tyrosine aminotransferase
MDAEDRILFVNTFSKNWAMTGWRIGWMRAHPSLGRMFENLVQYSTSGVAQFMQRGAIAALEKGDDFLAGQVAQAGATSSLHSGRRRAWPNVSRARSISSSLSTASAIRARRRSRSSTAPR